jgi:hypothetical protein
VPLSYPENTIWYVRTSFDDMELSEGSAVAARLQKRGEPKTAKTYLLTCAHAVRRASAKTSAIRAWPPDVGYNEKQAKDVEVDTTLKALPTSDPINAADDWIILEIHDAQAAMAAPTVTKWAGDVLSRNFRIWGYVGGESSFPQGKVLPTRTPNIFVFRDASNGTIHFNGQGTRFGISGGGVFGEVDVRFAGIHRARADDVLQVSAVSSSHIRRRLYELGYEVAATGTAEKALQKSLEVLANLFRNKNTAFRIGVGLDAAFFVLTAKSGPVSRFSRPDSDRDASFPDLPPVGPVGPVMEAGTIARQDGVGQAGTGDSFCWNNACNNINFDQRLCSQFV